ncbi:MAG: hypothetical protein AAGJ79_02870 [Verrucomicrobiota bacterium]
MSFEFHHRRWLLGILAVLLLILVTLLGTRSSRDGTAKSPQKGNAFNRVTAVGTGDSRPTVKRYTISKNVYRQLQKEAEAPLTHEDLFRAFDVEFEDDTYARYFPSLQQFVVHQTPANHSQIRRILRRAEAEARPPYQFRLTASMLSLPSGALTDDRLVPNGEVQALLRRHGANLSRVIAAPDMVLEEGQEGDISSVREYHLPIFLPDGRITSDVRLHGFSIEARPEVVDERIRITGSVTVHPLSSQRLTAVTKAFSEPGRDDLDFQTELFETTVEFDVQPRDSESALILCRDDPTQGEQVVMLLRAIPHTLDGTRVTLIANR